MTDQTTIERIVMRRVQLIRVLRFVISTGALSLLISTLALWGIGREVWVAHVLENAPANPADLPRFYLSAFGHTRLLVQGLILLTVASLMYLAFELARLVRVALLFQVRA